jgi:hypothetical protein
MGAVSTRPKDFFTAMKISSEILIDLSTSDSDADSSVLTNVDKLIHFLQCCISTIAHAYEPKLTFTRAGEGEFRCWIEASTGVFLEPQMPTIMRTDGGNPYRSAACLIMKQLLDWNRDCPTSESLEIPFRFRKG